MNKLLLILAIGAAAITGGYTAVRAAGDKPACLGDHPHGYGKCSSCSCRGFTGSARTCGNCGHYYSDHW